MFDGGATIDRQNFPKQRQVTLTLTLRLHVGRQPSLGRNQCETKTPESGTKPSKIITQLHPQRRFLCKAMPLAQLSKSHVCHEFACPIMPRVPPCSCTSRIPKQHSLDPPVRRQIRKISQHESQICSDVKRHCSDQIFPSFCCASATAFSFQ